MQHAAQCMLLFLVLVGKFCPVSKFYIVTRSYSSRLFLGGEEEENEEGGGGRGREEEEEEEEKKGGEDLGQRLVWLTCLRR